MTYAPVVHNTFVIERTYPAPPERVFRFFSDPAKKRRWFAESGYGGASFEMDFREGGAERSSSKMGDDTPFPGVTLSNDGVYQDIVPNVRVVLATSMKLGERRITSTLITFELRPKDGGTELVLTHQGCFYEGSDGPERREGGWRVLLDRLGQALADPA